MSLALYTGMENLTSRLKPFRASRVFNLHRFNHTKNFLGLPNLYCFLNHPLRCKGKELSGLQEFKARLNYLNELSRSEGFSQKEKQVRASIAPVRTSLMFLRLFFCGLSVRFPQTFLFIPIQMMKMSPERLETTKAWILKIIAVSLKRTTMT